LGQAPAVEVLLRARFLSVVLEWGWGAWAAYGFPVALGLARRIPGANLMGFAPEDVAGIEDLLQRCRELGVPDRKGAAAWPSAVGEALEALRTHRERLGRWLRGEVDGDGMGIAVPVVAAVAGSGEATGWFGLAPAGQILRLSVKAEAVPRRGSPLQLHVDGETSREAREAFREVLPVIERFRAAGTPPLARCWFGVRWSAKGARLGGASAGLAFALVALEAWDALAPGLRQRQLRGGVAATGRLSGSRVLPVEAATLAGKVGACFFSPVQVLCVPAEQAQAAQREAEALAAAYPGRRLAVRGVEDLRELAGRAGVVFAMRWRSASEATASWVNWFSRSRVRLGAAAVGLLLLVGMSAAAVVVTRNLPVRAEWEGDTVVARNRFGFPVMRVHAPVAPQTSNPRASRCCRNPNVLDADGDGRNEVLVIHGRELGTTDLMTLFDRHGNIVWRKDARRLLDETDERREDLIWWLACGPILGKDGRVEILAIRRSSQESPCLLVLLDAATGRTLGQLWNAGHLEDLYRWDVDGDGREERVALGTDNVTDGGLLVALDLEAMAAGGVPGNPEARTETGRIPFGPRTMRRVPLLTEPRALRAGVRLALLFPQDTFSDQIRVRCCGIVPGPEGEFQVTVAGRRFTDAVLYRFHNGPGGVPELEAAQITDTYVAAIRRERGGRLDRGEVAREEARLASEVRWLTPRGWEPVRRWER
jgi:hypothetical protein